MSAITNPALLPPGAAAIRPPAGDSAPARRAADAPLPGGASPASASEAHKPFADVLASVSQQGEAGQLRFSKHALQRVQRRAVGLDATTLGRLGEGVSRAASKGSRASVVLVDGTAFVVSVASRTVLTAVPQEHMKEQVFTNIDSAVIA